MLRVCAITGGITLHATTDKYGSGFIQFMSSNDDDQFADMAVLARITDYTDLDFPDNILEIRDDENP